MERVGVEWRNGFSDILCPFSLVLWRYSDAGKQVGSKKR